MQTVGPECQTPSRRRVSDALSRSLQGRGDGRSTVTGEHGRDGITPRRLGRSTTEQSDFDGVNTMPLEAQSAPVSKGLFWTGWVMSALPALFLLVDGVMKLVQPEVVVKTTVDLGYAEAVILPLGIVLLACTI